MVYNLSITLYLTHDDCGFSTVWVWAITISVMKGDAKGKLNIMGDILVDSKSKPILKNHLSGISINPQMAMAKGRMLKVMEDDL